MQMGRINVLMLVMRGSSPCEPRVDLTRRAAIHRRSAGVLDASTRVATAARSGLIDLHFALRCRPCGRVSGRPQRAHVRCCDEAVLASLTWICDAEQLYTDAALVLDTSTRIAAAARSGLIDLRFAPPLFDVSHFSGRLFFRP